MPARLLGARISTFALTIAVQATAAVAVVVMSADGRGHRSAVGSLNAVDALGVPLFYGGESFETGNNRRQVPGRYLGTRLGIACSVLVDALAHAGPTGAGRALAAT